MAKRSNTKNLCAHFSLLILVMSLEDKCTQTAAPNEQPRHQCVYCERSYKQKSHLTYHVKSDHQSLVKKSNYRFFQCRVCRQGRKKHLLLLSERRVKCFFVILAFATLSELHEHMHTLGKVSSATKNVAAPSPWRPWETAFVAGSAGEGGRGRKARRRRKRQEADVTVASAGDSSGPPKNAT